MVHPDRRIRRRSALFAGPLQILLAIILCVILPFGIQTTFLPKGILEPEAQASAIASLIALILGFALHRSVSALPGTRESSGILPAYLISFGAALTVILFFRIDYSRALLVAGFSLSIVWFFLVYLFTQRRSTLVLGIIEGGRSDLLLDIQSVTAVTMTLDTDPEGLDAVAADFRFDHGDAWEARIADYVLTGIPVYHAKDLHESLTGMADLEHLSENTFGALSPLAPFQKSKAVVDFVTAVPVALVLSPLLLLVSAAIRLDSSGPAFFRQRRVGYRGQMFEVIKFRTMHTVLPAEQSNERSQLITRDDDQRITRIGRFLRRTRIDELPQVINVLRGEMSWIGPRPEAAGLSSWYESELPFYRYRHIVVPGISGWAQVNQGHVAELTDVSTKLKYDFYYIRNFSVWLDLLIIAKTVRTVITGFGSK